MFNYITVSFPNTTVAPKYVYSFSFLQTRYEHEIAIFNFRDWGVEYDVIEAGSPIQFTLSGVGSSRTFYGYIAHVHIDRTPGTFTSEVVAIGASFVLKNEAQRIFKDLSADAIINQIAKENGFVAFTVPSNRIYPQVSQTGETSWQLMVKLAKQNGYSLRAENTEIYFQPMLYEYTSKRAEAFKFVMRDPNDSSGSTLYSFKPIIGEILDHDGDSKAAVSISGVDTSSRVAMAITNQNRNKTTRLKTIPETFDKFATHIVAPDALVAKYEAQAADDRNSFPYRGEAEVLGNANLRPDLPVYLDGVGGKYSGYWTILGTEHRVIETERNTQMYTTILHLGTDSLGTAVQWTDGQQIIQPSYRPARTIIPGVRQTNIVPVTNLVKSAPNLGPQSIGKLNKVTNRSIPTINNKQVKAPVWNTKTTTLNPISKSNKSSSTTPNRLLNKIPGIK